MGHNTMLSRIGAPFFTDRKTSSSGPSDFTALYRWSARPARMTTSIDLSFRIRRMT